MKWSLANVWMFEDRCYCLNKVGISKVATLSALDALQIYNSADSEDVDVEPSQSQPTSKPKKRHAIYGLNFKLETFKLIVDNDEQSSLIQRIGKAHSQECASHDDDHQKQADSQ